MATQNRFVSKNGLDNNGNTITNLGAANSSLGFSGGHAVTMTTTGTTNVTLPTSGTLVTSTSGAVTIGTTNINLGSTATSISGLQGLTMTSNADITLSGGGEVLGLPEVPSTSTAAVSKAYVDSLVTGLNVHAPVRAATTANLTATYNNGTGGVGATLTGTGALPTIDGVTLTTNDRVLVKNQTTQTQNGVYTVTTLSPNWVLTRATDFDDSPDGEVSAGDAVYVLEGAAAGTQWVQTTSGNITIGTTNIVFSQFGGPGSLSAGTGINVSGNTISNTGVLSFSAGTTGFTPNTSTTGAITLAGTLAATNGGTGQSSYAVGDVLFANTTTSLSRLAGVATGNALISGGTNTAPSWGKIGLTTHVTGTLPLANGGTGATTAPNARTNLGATTVGSNLFTLPNPSDVRFIRINADNTISALNSTDFINSLDAGTVISVDVLGGTTGLTTSGGPITFAGEITLGGTLVAGHGGTGQATYSTGDILHATGSTTLSRLTIGANGTILRSNGSSPTWATLSFSDYPGVFIKDNVRAATTANITLSGTQTIDGIALVAGNRVLVKNQTTQSQNGIYIVSAGAWTRSLDADTSAEIAGALVSVSSGTVNKGHLFMTYFGSTDTIGTTAMTWHEVADVDSAQDFTNKTINSSSIGATTRSSGAFTTLTSNGATTFTANTASTNTSTGTLVVTGGVGVSGTIHAGAFNGPLTGNVTGASSLNVLKAGDAMTGALAINDSASNGTASATFMLSATNGGNYGLFITPKASSTNWNALTQLNDTVIFTQSQGTADGASGLVIGPWSGSAKGIRIASSGNVGIGQSNPQSALGFANTGTISWGTTNFPYVAGDQPNNTLIFGTQATERVRINSAGNVGINVTDPGKRVDIDGTFRLRQGAASGYGMAEFGVSATASQNWHIGSEGDGTFRFYNGNFGAGTERVRVGAGGDTIIFGNNLRVNGLNNLLLQHDGTSAYIRPTNAGSTLFLGTEATNTMNMNTTGVGINGTLNVTGVIGSNNSVTVNNGTQGNINLNLGGASNTGFVSFNSHTSNIRQGYIGFGSTNLAQDTGEIRYVAGTHAFTGSLVNSSGALGNTAGNTTTMLALQGTNSNGASLQTFMLREAAGTDWTTASTRTQHRIDSTWQAWQQFNGNGNTAGIAWGTGQNATLTSVAERMRLNSSGVLSLSANVASTSNTTGTLVVTGGAGVSGQLSANNIVSSGSVVGSNIFAIRGGTAGQEGGHLVLGYGNNLATGITGQGNNTWNVDVSLSNEFRVFRQDGAGNAITAIAIAESNGYVNMVNTAEAQRFTANNSTIALRMKNSTDASGIATLLYTDATDFYFLMTNSGDANGSFNSLRPFQFNKSSGFVTMSNGVAITGGLTVDNGINSRTGAITARNAANQDSVVLQGRNGGTGSFNVFLTPAVLSGSRTLTLPDSDGTVALTSQIPSVGNGTLTMNVSGSGLSGSASFTANQSGNSTFTVTSNATTANTASTIVLRDANGRLAQGTVIHDGVGSVSIGYRSIPRVTSTTLDANSVGKCHAVTAGVTINSGIFAAGDAITIYNDSASAITITRGTITSLRLAGSTSDGNRTLAPRGICTIWFNSASEAIASGAGLT